MKFKVGDLVIATDASPGRRPYLVETVEISALGSEFIGLRIYNEKEQSYSAGKYYSKNRASCYKLAPSSGKKSHKLTSIFK